MCPWHAWEYSVVTGKGPEGYDEEQVPVYRLEVRADGVYMQTPPVMPRHLLKHKPSHLLEPHPKPAGAPPRVLGHFHHGDGRATRASPPPTPARARAGARRGGAGAETRSSSGCATWTSGLRRQLLEGARACTWPCAITERDPADELDRRSTRAWCTGPTCVMIATPIRWGNARSLYFKMVERLNCIQNQLTIHNRRLIVNKVAALIITGGQDNIQAVAGGMLTFWAELGFVFPAFPFIAHSRGWDAEDMQNNVRQVRDSAPLRVAAGELAERALATWRVLDQHRAEVELPMDRAGRKANPLTPAEEAAP